MFYNSRNGNLIKEFQSSMDVRVESLKISNVPMFEHCLYGRKNIKRQLSTPYIYNRLETRLLSHNIDMDLITAHESIPNMIAFERIYNKMHIPSWVSEYEKLTDQYILFNCIKNMSEGIYSISDLFDVLESMNIEFIDINFTDEIGTCDDYDDMLNLLGIPTIDNYFNKSSSYELSYHQYHLNSKAIEWRC